MVELKGDITDLAQRVGAEEVGRVVILAQQGLLVGLYHGGELLKVANHQQLDAAEGQTGVAETAQHVVNGIEQVAAHHADFVDYKQVERAHDVALLLREVVASLERGRRDIRRQRQLEKAVDGHAAGVDGGHTRGSHHHHALRTTLANGAQEGGLPRSGAARQEDAHARVLHKIPSLPKLLVFLHINAFCPQSYDFLPTFPPSSQRKISKPALPAPQQPPHKKKTAPTPHLPRLFLQPSFDTSPMFQIHDIEALPAK